MLQTLIAAIIVVLAAVWMLKIALTRVNPPSDSKNSCGCGCSGCSQSSAQKINCGGTTPPQQ